MSAVMQVDYLLLSHWGRPFKCTCIFILSTIYRIGKTRDLLKKIRDTKETFHAKMGTIQSRNDMDLTEDIKRWQEYKEELYKKDLNDPDNYDGVITHLEPDILECEVKWA